MGKRLKGKSGKRFGDRFGRRSRSGRSRALLLLGNSGNAPLEQTFHLLGGDPTENAAELAAVLAGHGRPAYRDAVLLNAAAALIVADRVTDLKAGVALAREAIESGAASEKVRALARLLPIE